MAFALVGAVGAVTVGGGGGSITPAWGVGSSQTAGNTLVLWVAGDSVASLPAAPSGWTVGKQVSGTLCSASVFFKVAVGGDAAPTVASIASDVLIGQLAEFSGGATSTPLDQTASATGTTTPIVATAGGTDVASGELIVTCGAARYTGAAAHTLTDTYNNGATATSTSNNASSTANHYCFSYGVTTGNSSADSNSFAYGTTSISGAAVVLASFKLGSTNFSAPGVTAGLTLAAPAGVVDVTLPGATAALALSAPAGQVDVTLPGATAGLTFAAPAGRVDVGLPGATASLTLAAPAGTVSVTLPGATARLTFAAPAGAVTFPVAPPTLPGLVNPSGRAGTSRPDATKTGGVSPSSASGGVSPSDAAGSAVYNTVLVYDSPIPYDSLLYGGTGLVAPEAQGGTDVD